MVIFVLPLTELFAGLTNAFTSPSTILEIDDLKITSFELLVVSISSG
jgi:hypothetical protein